MAVLFELVNKINKLKSVETARLLKSLAGVLGLLSRDATAFLQGTVIAAAAHATGKATVTGVGEAVYSPEGIERLIDERVAARKAKNFAEGDRIRKQLLDAGIVLEDTAQGTIWRRS